jgi:hypothetical protein
VPASSDTDASEWRTQQVNTHIYEIDFPVGDGVYATNKVGALLSLRLALPRQVACSGSLYLRRVHLRGWLLRSAEHRFVCNTECSVGTIDVSESVPSLVFQET